MVVPFQMVMFTLSKTADQLNLNTPWNICIISVSYTHLTVIDFTSEPSFPAELDRVYKITEGVMRSLIIAHEE